MTDTPSRLWENRIIGYEADVEPDQLLASPLNARRHPGQQRGAINAALGHVGWVDVVKVNQNTGRVVDGHARIEEALSAGETVPVLWLDLTEDEERYALATLDPIAGMAVYDADVLEALTDGLEFEDPLRELLDGIAEGATTLPPLDGGDPLGDPDPGSSHPPEVPVCQPDDLWLIGPHRLVIGDAASVDSWETLCAGYKGQMLWTDPPYGVSYVGKTADALTIENDSLTAEHLEAMLTSSFGLAVTHLFPGAAWFTAAPPGPLFFTFAGPLLAAGIWRQTIMWLKDRFVMGRNDYHYRYEPIFYGWTPGAAHHEPPDRTQDTVWEFPRPARSEEHPTMKPVELVERAITNHTDAGAIVLDPFLGSGTTLIAAHRTGRVGWGIELDPHYGDVILRRLQAVTGTTPVLEATGQPHDFLADQSEPDATVAAS